MIKANNHKITVISPLGGWEAQHVVHGDGFPWPVKSRKRVAKAIFLSGRFGNRTGSAGPDIIFDFLSKFYPVEMFLQHCNCIFDVEVSCHLTLVGFPYHLHSLTF
jgi:hypothetical protein